jgi:hypothetical protein
VFVPMGDAGTRKTQSSLAKPRTTGSDRRAVRVASHDQLLPGDRTSIMRGRPVDQSHQTTTNFDPCRRCASVRMRTLVR